MRGRILAGIALITLMGADAVAQNAQPTVEARVDRIERELRAVQRRVFPGSDGTLFPPQAQPGEAGATPAGPGSTPVADLTARVDALEAQLARLTGQVEQQGFRMREFETAMSRMQADLTAARNATTTEPDGASSNTLTPTPTPRPAPAPTPAPRPTPAPAPAATGSNGAAPAGATAQRRQLVAAVEVPSTGDAPEDDYIYGYRLWEARLYPEAQAQLQRVVERHGSHRRASYAGNLLGRAFLDNNQPALAVTAFYNNYRDRPRGERAAQSLYFMGMALIRLDRRTDACRTFGEFDRIYGATADETLRAQVAEGRVQARC